MNEILIAIAAHPGPFIVLVAAVCIIIATIKD